LAAFRRLLQQRARTTRLHANIMGGSRDRTFLVEESNKREAIPEVGRR
jgi:hypothetical protein